jgi:hypothetical protein
MTHRLTVRCRDGTDIPADTILTHDDSDRFTVYTTTHETLELPLDDVRSIIAGPPHPTTNTSRTPDAPSSASAMGHRAAHGRTTDPAGDVDGDPDGDTGVEERTESRLPGGTGGDD